MSDKPARVCTNCQVSLYITYKRWGEYWSFKKHLYCSKKCITARENAMPMDYEEPLRHV